MARDSIDPGAANVSAEQMVLGELLIGSDFLGRLRAHHFADPVHAELFHEIGRRAARRELVSPVALRRWADGHSGLAALGGAAYLVRLAAAAPGPSMMGGLVAFLEDQAAKRALGGAAQAVLDAVAADSAPAAEIISQLERSILDIAPRRASAPVTLAAAAHAAVEDMVKAMDGAAPGVATGIRALDAILGNLEPGALVLLAGRPGMGKSAVALQVALNIARAGAGVAFSTLEMTPAALASRALSETTGRAGGAVSYASIRRGSVDQTGYRRVSDAAREIGDLPLVFLPSECRDAAALAAGVRRAAAAMHGRAKLGLVVVDYLQLMRGEGRTRYEQITEISLSLKALALRFDVPVLALSQLSRQVENREDKRPQLCDLRESGQLEQDADVVMFVFREETYLAADKPEGDDFAGWSAWQAAMDRCRNRLDLIVAKNRNGPTGVARVSFSAETGRIWEA